MRDHNEMFNQEREGDRGKGHGDVLWGGDHNELPGDVWGMIILVIILIIGKQVRKRERERLLMRDHNEIFNQEREGDTGKGHGGCLAGR